MTDAPRLRFGILCDGDDLAAWQRECLDELRRVEGCVPVVVVVNASEAPDEGWLARARASVTGRRLGWSLFDRLVASRKTPTTARHAFPSWINDLERISCAVERRGRYSEYFTQDVLRSLRELNLDFMIKFGFGIVRGEALTVARHGIWSFHHDDETKYRGAPPGFWEIYGGDPVTGSILQRLTDRLDGGVVLRRGHFATIPHSYTKNRDQAFAASAIWPAQVCRDLLNGEARELEAAPSSSKAPVFRYPNDLQAAIFTLRLAGNWLRHQLDELLFCEMWNIGIVDVPIEELLRASRPESVRWFEPLPGDRYVADPSGITREGETWIFAEDYGYLEDRGTVVARRSADGLVAQAWKQVLSLKAHLSYPMVFERGADVFCLPECAQSGEIALYRADPFPDRWTKVATLVEGFPGVDPTLLFHEGRWWVFCTDLRSGKNSHLHVFHADALEGPYRPHANNPVKIDVRGSRCAGPFFKVGDDWVRPAQNDSRTYGGSITFQRLVRLTPTAFEEQAIGEFHPERDGPFAEGLHTVHPLGDRTLVDGKRRRVVPRVFLERLRKKAMKLVPGYRPLRTSRS